MQQGKQAGIGCNFTIFITYKDLKRHWGKNGKRKKGGGGKKELVIYPTSSLKFLIDIFN